MANKLKKMELSSVDLVHAGANQEANITFFKNKSTGGANTPTAEFNSCIDSFAKGVEAVLKGDRPPEAKAEEMQQGLMEFSEYITKAFEPWSKSQSAMQPQAETPVEKNEKEGAEMTDVSKMSKEELEALQKSISDELAKNHKPADPKPETPKDGVEKSVDPAPAKTELELPESIKKSMETMEAMIEKSERAEIANVAKKYEILGQDAEKLADDLYKLKKSNQEAYDSTISILDSQVDMIEKSGLFSEIGKSGAGMEPSEGKAEAIAKSLMEKDHELTYQQAFVKAIEMNPALQSEYDK